MRYGKGTTNCYWNNYMLHKKCLFSSERKSVSECKVIEDFKGSYYEASLNGIYAFKVQTMKRQSNDIWSFFILHYIFQVLHR